MERLKKILNTSLNIGILLIAAVFACYLFIILMDILIALVKIRFGGV